MQSSPFAISDQVFGSGDDLQFCFGPTRPNRVSPNVAIGNLSSPAASDMAQSHPHDCTSLAFSTLHSLHLPSCSAPSSGTVSSSLPTIDQVLVTNRAAVQSVLTLLACPCSTDRHLPLLLAVITSKILAWYQAIVCVNINGSSQTTSSLSVSSLPHSSTTVAATSYTHLESVIHTPITLGAYTLDGEDEERLRVQLVLGELKRVDNLVEKFCERFCRGSEGDAVNMDQGGERGGVYPTLETFLRTRLKETVRGTVGEFRSQMMDCAAGNTGGSSGTSRRQPSHSLAAPYPNSHQLHNTLLDYSNSYSAAHAQGDKRGANGRDNFLAI